MNETLIKIAITTSTFGKYNPDIFLDMENNGFLCVRNLTGRKLQKDELLELAAEAVGIIAGTEIYDGSVLANLPNLKVISRCGTGVDNIDLLEASKRNIAVLTTPDAPSIAVAELTVGLMLDLLRGITLSDRLLRKGIWEKHMGFLLRGKRVGIIGLGRIGSQVARLLKSFNVHVAYYDVKKQKGGEKLQWMRLEKLLGWADIVTIHCSPGKKPILSANEIAMMRRGAFLLNLSRAENVDEDALYNALSSGHLSAAAIDVFKREPYDGKLRNLENVVLTPHIGSYAIETRIEQERQAVNNIIQYFKGYRNDQVHHF